MPAQNTNVESLARGAITVRGLAAELKVRLRVRAAHNARSMEAEARAILEAALAAPEEEATDLASFARGLFAPLGGVELELPAREPPNFDTKEDEVPAAGVHRPDTPAGSPSAAIRDGTRRR